MPGPVGEEAFSFQPLKTTSLKSQYPPQHIDFIELLSKHIGTTSFQFTCSDLEGCSSLQIIKGKKMFFIKLLLNEIFHEQSTELLLSPPQVVKSHRFLTAAETKM